MKIAASLALGTLLGAAIACGGRQQTGDPGSPLRVEVANLWTQIRQWRSEARMQLDPPNQLVAWVGKRSVNDLKRNVCREGQAEPPVCRDICSIADNICDNAERICQIATQLGASDDFAQEKCASAKASCREAKQNCCGCSDKNQAVLETSGGTTW